MELERCRLGNCEVCGANVAKYTCPKCEVKTCALKCVNIHKKELECDGIRDKTKYIPISKFTNLDLLSDYRFLEDATRTVESIKKDTTRNCTRFKRRLPNHLFLLKRVLQSRKTNIHFLPPNFNKNKKNSTHYNKKTDTVFWRIEWKFLQADNLRLTDNNCNENDKLSSILNRYLDATIYKNDSLQFYQSCGLNGLNLFLKAEFKKGDKCYCLDSDLSIKENLRKKDIVEFPTILVTFRQQNQLFDIIDDSDEEMESNEIINPINYVSKIVKEEEKNNIAENGSLLFGIDYSDSDTENDT